MPPTSGLRRQGTPLGSPAGFQDLSGWGQCPPLLSCSPSPAGSLPSHLPLLLSPSLPPMPPEPMRPEEGFGGQGTRLGHLAGFPGSSGQGQCPLLLLLLQSWRAPPPTSPVLPWPPSYAPRTSEAWRGPLRV